MRRIAVLTVARSDYGLLQPLLEKVEEDAELELLLIAGGMHLSPAHGHTIDEVERDGYRIAEKVEFLLSSDTPEGLSQSMGLGIIGFTQALSRIRPDLLVVLGDRFETLSAALAAYSLRIPIAHLHGGEVTSGALDDGFRHCITKLSHLHLTSTERYAERVRQLGEDPERVVVTGALSIDNTLAVPRLSLDELNERFGLSLTQPFLLITFHPATLEYDQTAAQIDAMLAALDRVEDHQLFTAPNADSGGYIIRERIEAYASERDRVEIVENLGREGYISALALASCMVGNSSSGMVEAAPFRLPVVNIGNRQAGRERSRNIIQAGNETESIHEALARARSTGFRADLSDLVSAYGDGRAADRIVKAIKSLPSGAELAIKQFRDLPGAPAAGPDGEE